MTRKSTLILAFALLLSPSISMADELDSLLDYLVEVKQAQRATTDAKAQSSKRASLAQPAQNFHFFRSTDGYQLDPVTSETKDGTIRLSTTYYSISGKGSFEVAVIQPSTDRFDEARLGKIEKLQELDRLYQKASEQHLTTVQGFPTAFFEVKGDTSEGAIASLGNGSFLVVKASKSIALEAIKQFASILPLEEISYS